MSKNVILVNMKERMGDFDDSNNKEFTTGVTLFKS